MLVFRCKSWAILWWVCGTVVFQLQLAQAQLDGQALAGYELTFPAMGTTVTFAAFVHEQSVAEKAFHDARAEIDRLVTVLSDYEDDSELSLLNAHAGRGESVAVSTDLWNVLEAADRWHKTTNGAFDCSIGSLTRLWRAARRKRELPTPGQIETALGDSGWKNVTLDPENRRVQIDRKGVLLDLGAIAKGYIVDRAFETLQQHSIKRCMVNAGGDLRCGDAPPDRIGWRVAIAPLAESGPPLRVLSLSNAAIATSGDLWQYSLIDGVRRSHILDPATGMGIAGPQSVSAIAPTALDADAAATALGVLGPQRGTQFAETQPAMEALITSKLEDQPSTRYSVTTGFSR